MAIDVTEHLIKKLSKPGVEPLMSKHYLELIFEKFPCQRMNLGSGRGGRIY